MAKIDERLKDILSKYHPDPDKAVWNCRGTWVAYHKAIELMSARAGIYFDAPVIVEMDSANKVAVILAQGHLGDKTVWSFGEASPHNNKNEYCVSMAEKRAVDRVVLKLLGLHGEIYSEDEADDFKNNAPSDADLKADIEDQEDSAAFCKDLLEEMRQIETVHALQNWGKTNAEMISDLRESDQRTIRKEFTAMKSRLTIKAA